MAKAPQKLLSCCVFGVIVVLSLVGNIQRVFFQPLEGLNLLGETRRKGGPITRYVAYTWCYSQPSGPLWVPRAVPTALQARQCQGIPDSWHPASMPLPFVVAWKPCWPQGTFWKRMDVVKCIADSWQSCKGGLKALGLGSKHRVLPAQQSAFPSELYKTGRLWRLLSVSNRG